MNYTSEATALGPHSFSCSSAPRLPLSEVMDVTEVRQRSLRSQGRVEELQQLSAVFVPLFVLLGLLHLHLDLFP